MANFVDENFGAQSTPVEINDIVPTTVLPPLPMAAQKARAAQTALLSSSNPVQNYQLMMNEAQGGDDSLIKQGREIAQNDAKTTDMKGVMLVLSDPNLSLEQKRAVISQINNNSFLKDGGNLLFSKSLEAPSKGETVEHEDARISSADAIREIYQSRQDVQGIVNAHGASLQTDSSARTLGEVVELNVMPFGNSINTGKLYQAFNKTHGSSSWWNTIKGYILPGSATANIRDTLERVPPEKRAEFAQSLVKDIQANSGILFSNDNQFAQYDKATSIFEEGGYTGLQEFVDNVSPLLDALGVGQLIRSGTSALKVGAKAGTKALAGEAAKTAEPIARATTAERVYQSSDMASVSGRPTAGAYDSRIAELESQRADLLGSATSNLDKGGVARLEAEKAAIPKPKNKYERADYNAQVARIDQMLEQNRSASTVSQQIDALDKKIAELQKNNTPVFLKKNYMEDVIDRLNINNPVRQVNPASPGEVIGTANPQRARDLHEAMFKAQDNQAAEAIFGTSREQAIINNVYPQATTETGTILSRVSDVDKNLRQELHVPDELINTLDNQSLSMYTAGEKAAARAHVVNNFQTAEGLTINPAMGGFNLEGGKFHISAVYGNADGSFKDAEQAVAQAKFALRNEGVLDHEIEILSRKGMDYVPVKLDDVRGVEGDYLVRVNTTHEVDPTDIGGNFDKLDVKKNWFDRIGITNWATAGGNRGSVTRWMFDAASLLHPTLTKAGSVASDATARFERVMLEQASKFTDAYMDHSKERRALMDNYIREANYNGLKFDTTDLMARGFSPDEINTLGKWKNYWDAQYYLENRDMVKSLNAGGFQILDNNNATLFAKPIAKNQNIVKVYDSASNTILHFSKADGDNLYNTGGTLAKLRRPAVINGDTVEHVIVRNTPTEYLRKVRDNDRVLNYRDGYYTQTYKAPRFVDQVIRDANGNPSYTKAIAVAGDTAEATRFSDRMAVSQGVDRADFTVRGDVRNAARDEDAHWDLTASSGRIAQRVRGKLLEDAAGLNHLGDGSFVASPVESAIRAAKSISGRTVSRPMLDAGKERAIKQYGHLFPSDGMGGVRWPKGREEITAKGVYSSKELADARTTFEYLNYLENGYQNSLDDFTKAMFNAMSEWAGGKGWSTLERGAAKAGDVGLTHKAKQLTFISYLGLNPIRQWVVQMNQVARTFAYDPRSMGRVPYYAAEYLSDKLGQKQGGEFTKWIDQSGLLDAVDKHNLVRGSLTSAVDESNAIQRGVAAAVHLPQKFGFNVGEQGNILGHAAAVFGKYKGAGKSVTSKEIMDEMTAEVRALSYGQNYAGDMPYNQTSLAFALQFAQVPHKALLFMSNRQIDFATRARMGMMDLVFWGAPAGLVGLLGKVAGTDLLPDNADYREMITDGIQSFGLNYILNEWFDAPGEKSKIDFSGLAPYEMTGWFKFFSGIFTDGLSSVLMNSPAGQLLYKKDGGSRVQNIVRSMGRYFNIIDDVDQTPETFVSVLNEVAKLSSGWNNGLKAKLMLETGKKMDQYGSVIDKDTTNIEAYAQALGFGTHDEAMFYETVQDLSKRTKDHRDATIQAYKDIKRYYAEALEKPETDVEFIQKVSGWALHAFKDDPVGMSIIYKEWAKDMVGSDAVLAKKMMDAAGLPTPSNLADTIRSSPLSEEDKAIALQRLQDFATVREQLKKEK